MCDYRIVKLDPEVLEITWLEFKATGDLELRNALMLHYSPTVRYVAGKISETLPAMVDREDLVSYGMLGLMDAIEKFELAKGMQFQTYGVHRIRGEIYDQIRALDWVPRSVRSQARTLDKARKEVELTLGRPAEHHEVAGHMGLSMSTYNTSLSQSYVPQMSTFASVSASSDDDSYEQDSVYDPMMNPESLVETGEVIGLVAEAVNDMDQRSKTILVLYYLQEMTLAEIGKILGVTESRVCQLQSKMLSSLRDSLGSGSLAGAL